MTAPKPETPIDWSECLIQAKSIMRQAEHELNMGRRDTGRRYLRAAIYHLTRAADGLYNNDPN